MSTQYETIHLSLDESMARTLIHLAVSEGTSVGKTIKELLVEALDHRGVDVENFVSEEDEDDADDADDVDSDEESEEDEACC